MLSDLYNEKILGYAANISRLGRLPAPDGTATHRSRLCGSQVTVDVRVEDGRVVEFAHDVKACALGQASSAIMAESVIGATLDELRAAHDAMQAMLTEGGPPPEGRFAEARFLEPVRDHKSRHASTMLTFQATLDAAAAALAKSEGATQARVTDGARPAVRGADCSAADPRGAGGSGACAEHAGAGGCGDEHAASGCGRTTHRSSRTLVRRTPELALRLPILLYRHSVSLFLGRHCRYLPTCSQYADEAIRRHGAWVGAWLALARLARCHPFGPAGFDPVPDLPADARRRPWRHARWTGRHMKDSRLDV